MSRALQAPQFEELLLLPLLASKLELAPLLAPFIKKELLLAPFIKKELLPLPLHFIYDTIKTKIIQKQIK